jgi:homoserine kinase
MSHPDSVTLRIPASTSNCGPGFDTLGCAVTLYNFVKLQRLEGGSIQLKGADCDASSLKMVEEAAQLFFHAADREAFPFEAEIWGEIPTSRGLGSSASIRAGIVAGLNSLSGAGFGKDALVRIVTSLDHAPDNACACIHGGFVVARTDPRSGKFIDTYKFPVENRVSFVVLSPETCVSTVAARQVLPAELPFWEAVRSINSVAGIVGAFATGQYEKLRQRVYDGVHQPYRKLLNPFVEEAVAAGVDAGAWDGWLSGSGSSIVCLCDQGVAQDVGRAMQTIFQENGQASRVFYLQSDNEGLTTA